MSKKLLGYEDKTYVGSNINKRWGILKYLPTKNDIEKLAGHRTPFLDPSEPASGLYEILCFMQLDKQGVQKLTQLTCKDEAAREAHGVVYENRSESALVLTDNTM